MSDQEYKAIAAWTYGPIIAKITYGIEDRVYLLTWENGIDRGHKVYYGNRPFIRFLNRRFYLDEALRTNLGG